MKRKNNLIRKPVDFMAKPNQILFVVLLIAFIVITFTLGRNLQRGIIPDEDTHIKFVFEFAKTWSIPKDSEVTYKSGTYIEDRPFLFYWIGGRLDNLFELLSPKFDTIDRIIFQRHINSLYAGITVLFCFLLSKKIIQNPWWQLLPPFLLINTLMYVTISSGVNYDNLVNALVSGSLFFFIRSLDSEKYLVDSLIWMCLGALAVLTKVTALPVIGSLIVLWVYLTIKNKKKLSISSSQGIKKLWLIPIILSIFLAGSFYASNLIRYQSIVPDCEDFLDASICELNPQWIRAETLGLDVELTPITAIEYGYYDPVQYAFYMWPHVIAQRTFGILGHKSYIPYPTGYFPILFVFLFMVGLRTIKKINLSIISISVTFSALALTHFVLNYQSELFFGFRNLGLQGRYLFPVIGGFYALATLGLSETHSRLIKYGGLIVTLALFVYCGPLKFIIGANSFTGWFR